jgi:hypothetical protein
MLRATFLLILVIAIVGCAPAITRQSAPPAAVPVGVGEGNMPPRKAFKVVVLILENEDQMQVMQNKDLSFLQKIAEEGAVLSNYSAITHPSQPNYVAMISGSHDGVNGDHAATLDRPYIGKSGLSWAAYAEDYSDSGCPLDERIGKYARKHVPFLSFKDIQVDERKRCDHVKNLQAFFCAARNHELPDLSFLIPNLDNDGHDKPLKDADAWLMREILPVIQDPWFRREVVLVVTFDEDGSEWPYWRKTNLIYTALWGDHIEHASRTEPYNHYSLLRTLEEIFGVEPMAQGDREANVIRGIWK